MNQVTINIPKGFSVDSFDQESGVISFKPLPKDVKERIKTKEDAFKALGVSASEVIPSGGLDQDQEAIRNYAVAVVITRALNEGWEPDWDNHSEYKYYPWFKMSSSGFSYVGYGNDYSISFVGSRLCFKSKDLAKYAGEQFKEIYESFFTIK